MLYRNCENALRNSRSKSWTLLGGISLRRPAPESESPRSLRCSQRDWSCRDAASQRRPARACRISRPRRSAYLSAPIGRRRRRWTCSITSRSCENRRARNCRPRSGMGQRITGMTSGQTTLPVARVDLQVSAVRPIRRVGQRAAAAHGQNRRRHHHHQDGEHGRHQSRSGDHVYPDRQPAAGTAQHGRVGELWTGQRESRICRRSW